MQELAASKCSKYAIMCLLSFTKESSTLIIEEIIQKFQGERIQKVNICRGKLRITANVMYTQGRNSECKFHLLPERNNYYILHS